MSQRSVDQYESSTLQDHGRFMRGIEEIRIVANGSKNLELDTSLSDEFFPGITDGICVFAGSRHGRSPDFITESARLGQLIGRSGRPLVFGAGPSGLMAEVSAACLLEGGSVIGIVPSAISKIEADVDGRIAVIEVPNLSTRKDLMLRISSTFVALPGGYGTLDEILHVIACAQLGFASTVLHVVNIGGYFDPVLAVFERFAEMQFCGPESQGLYNVVDSVASLGSLFEIPLQ